MSAQAVAAVLLAFLLGSLLPGYWIGRFVFKKNLLTEGSGNIGATNAFRVLGPVVGTVVLILDIAKGAAAVWVSREMNGVDPICGLAAIIGHTFSPFLKFRGGKGVATGLGVFLMLAPKPTFAAIGMFILALAITRRVSIGSCLAALTLGVSTPVFSRDIFLIGVTEIVVVLVLFRHRSNIRRIIHGDEPALF